MIQNRTSYWPELFCGEYSLMNSCEKITADFHKFVPDSDLYTVFYTFLMSLSDVCVDNFYFVFVVVCSLVFQSLTFLFAIFCELFSMVQMTVMYLTLCFSGHGRYVRPIRRIRWG